MATASGNKTVNLRAYDRDQSYQRVDFSQPQKPAALSAFSHNRAIQLIHPTCCVRDLRSFRQ